MFGAGAVSAFHLRDHLTTGLVLLKDGIEHGRQDRIEFCFCGFFIRLDTADQLLPSFILMDGLQVRIRREMPQVGIVRFFRESKEVIECGVRSPGQGPATGCIVAIIEESFPIECGKCLIVGACGSQKISGHIQLLRFSLPLVVHRILCRHGGRWEQE